MKQWKKRQNAYYLGAS